jgi:hypothetical protein
VTALDRVAVTTERPNKRMHLTKRAHPVEARFAGHLH